MKLKIPPTGPKAGHVNNFNITHFNETLYGLHEILD